MNFAETLKLALSAVWAHKLRSVLTLLGMIIGVMSVVIVVSLIQGFNRYVDEKIAGIGAKSYTVQRFGFEDWKDQDTIAAAQRRNKDLTLDEMEYIRQRATLTDKLGAQARPTRVEVKYQSKITQDVPLSGATPNTVDINKLEIEDGRYFGEAENDAASNVAFIGADVAKELFENQSPIGKEIVARGLPYRVIGVMTAKGTVFGQPQDNFILIPLKTYSKNFGGLVQWRSLYFQGTAKNDLQFADAVEEARNILRQKRGLKFGEKDNFSIMTPDAVTGLRDRLFGTISVVAIGVPSIALIIAAIVIMNIMLVSVTERTKEIGIRKALGAKQRDIIKQFLVEAATLAIIGGATGIFLAWAIGQIITKLLIPTYLSIPAVIVALLVSGGIGVLAGIFPAWKAARLDPIEALRAD